MNNYPITVLRNNGKTIRPEDFPSEAWNTISGGEREGTAKQDLYSRVSWVFRSFDILANGISMLPFSIEDLSGNEVDNDKDYQNVVGFLPYPREIFSLSEMALNAFGYNYLYKRPNLLQTKIYELRYMLPTSIHPKWAKDTNGRVTGLGGFDRDGSDAPLPVEQVVYMWLRDPWVEFGPAKSSPLMAAAAAAGVVLNLDNFASLYFERGAIKATILAVSGNPPEKEKNRIKSLWARLFKGTKGLFGEMVMEADALKPIVVGEGLEALKDNGLSNEKREAIATALGIPYSMLFSSSAKGLGGGGVAQQDEVNLYKQKIVPDANFIAEKLNGQLFIPAGYRLKFKHEEMDLFQEDENQRATSMNQFADVLTKVKTFEELLAMFDIFGYEVSDDAMGYLEKSFAAKQERAAAMTENLQSAKQPTAPPQPTPPDNTPQDQPQKRTDLDRWHTKVSKAIKAGKSAAVSFESDEIPAAIQGAIHGALEGAKDLAEVDRIFGDTWIGYP